MDEKNLITFIGPITSFWGLKIAHCVQREYICSLVLLAVDEKCKIYAPSSYSLSTLFLMRRICKWVHHVEMGVPKQIPHPRILISSMIASSRNSNMAAAATSILWLVGLVAKKGASSVPSAIDGDAALFQKKNRITFLTFAHKIHLLVDIFPFSLLFFFLFGLLFLQSNNTYIEY